MAKYKGRRVTRRDNYGRYKGKASIKPYKSNLPKLSSNRPRYVPKGSGQHNATSGYKPGHFRTPAKKKSNTKRNIAIGVGAAMTVGAVGYGAYRFHKSRQAKPTTGRMVMRSGGINARSIAIRPGQSKFTGLRKNLSAAGIARGTAATLASVAAAAASPVEGNFTPQNKAQRRASNPVVVQRMAPQVSSSKKINASSIVADAGAAAKAAKASVTVSKEDRKSHEAAGKRWAEIEKARAKGIPAAASFVDSGGNVDTWRPSAIAKPAAVENARPTDNRSASPVAGGPSYAFRDAPNGKFVNIRDAYNATGDPKARNKKWQNSTLKGQRTTGYDPSTPFVRVSKLKPTKKVEAKPVKKRASAVDTSNPEKVENAKPMSIHPKAEPAEKPKFRQRKQEGPNKPIAAPPAIKGKPAKSAKVKDGKVDDEVVVVKFRQRRGLVTGGEETLFSAPPTKTVAPPVAKAPEKVVKGPIPVEDFQKAAAKYMKANNEDGLVEWLDKMEGQGYRLNREQRKLVGG